MIPAMARAGGKGDRVAATVWRGGWLARLVLLWSLALSAAAAAPEARPQAVTRPTSLTVVLDDNYPPYIYRTADGQLQGLLKDSWALWERYTGVPVNLIATDWSKAQSIMKAGGADVLDTVFVTESRRQLYDFSEPYARINVPIFFHKSVSGIVDPESLHGFVVGVKEGDACIEALQEHGQTSFKHYRSYAALVRGAAAEEVRVFCIDEPPALFLLYQMGLEETFRHSEPLYTGEFHRAVHKGQSALLAMVEAGFARIPPAEHQQLERKWLGADLPGRPLPDLARYAGYGLLAIGSLALILFGWNRSLRRRVEARTDDLRRTLEALRQASDERERAHQELALVSFALNHVKEAAYLADRNGYFHYVNDEACRVLGYSREELLTRRVIDVDGDFRQQEQWDASWNLTMRQQTLTFESHHTTRGGQVFPVEISANYFEFGGEGYILGLVRDITERKRAEEQIRSLAYFDPLTSLPNRRLLMDRLGQALIASARSHQFGALIILDLDNFKTLNDTQGHDVGDRLLVEVARRLLACVREEDTVARLGGDEYVVMVENLGPEEASAAGQAEMIAEKIRRSLGQRYQLNGGEAGYHNTSSMGLTLFLGQASSAELLLKQADVALYQAKDGGRNMIRFFNPAMQAAIDSRTAVEAALRQGLAAGEFRLFYQPQFDQEGRLLGAEALLRWLPAGRGPVSPGEFIPLAEDTGLILPIGLWVLETACEQIAAWSTDSRCRDLVVAVNVSARQFREPDFLHHVAAILAGSGANPARLKLELTERVVLDRVEEVISRMRELRALGIGFSLDDFGTGYSSLSYLKRLPLDQVKIDQSFVRDLTQDPNDAAIVRAIIAMSRSLGLEVLAEGVETDEQRRFLYENGCQAYQGYLFGRPVPIEEWPGLLDRQT
jgi:diguanylate cyclase (GGDEF)-like protein/PAS domain S-box-containing protein